MKNWVIALIILILPIAAYYALDKNSAQKAAFEAQAAQNTANKPVVIKFYSPMCLDCKKLESVVKEVLPEFSDRIVYKNINGLSNDKVSESLVQKYNVTLVPTMVFLKKDGSLYKRTEGCLAKEQLHHILKEITK